MNFSAIRVREFAHPSGSESVAVERIIETVTLSDQVRNYLLEDMTTGRLRPGDRINEAGLARRLGISRNPIREAIAGLAERGYLMPLPRRGHCIRPFTIEDVNDVFSFRTCVESFAIRQAMPHLTEADVADVEAILERMVAAARDGRVGQVRSCDLALHRRICELSRNRQTLRAHEIIETEVLMLIACVDLEHESLMQSALIHVPIVEALRSGDVEATVAAMERHIAATWSDVLKIYEETRRARQAAGPSASLDDNGREPQETVA